LGARFNSIETQPGGGRVTVSIVSLRPLSLLAPFRRARCRALASILTAAIVAGLSPALAAASTLGPETVLQLDPARTTVQFTLGDILHTVHGNFKLRRGAIRFDPATGRIAGEVVVDATSGASGSEGRDRRMHKNILESARYPDIVFTPDRVEGAVSPQGTSQLQVHGMFRIHGAAHEITLPVLVQMDNGRATAITHFSIPYVKWGMRNPSTLFLRVSDKVDLDITAYTQ
jgi:polyisoprenoid-binding protein YceI